MTQRFTSDVVIGLETHAELATKTKLFCSCSRIGQDEEEPNSRTCPTCLGMPGAKPVLNSKAVEYALKMCLAMKCEIAKELVFSRKSYFYPDMAKNYQITQYELPLGSHGQLKLSSGKTIGITRIHLEEDPAALVHQGDISKSQFVLVDYNRSGNPLLEIVSEPDMQSADEARDYMNQLITILNYLSIFEIGKCIIKADANISIKESGYQRVEIKNITGFREIERALEYEIMRQKAEAKEGHKITAETRGWDSENGITYSMREKESEEEYGYIIDPDLVITDITDDMIKSVKDSLPELAHDKLRKFLETHKIEETTANVLAKNKSLAGIYEEVIKEIDPVLASKWIRRDLQKVLNQNHKSLEESGITPAHLITLLKLLRQGKLTDRTAQEILEKLGEKPFDIARYVESQSITVVSDRSELEEYCRQAIAESAQAVSEYKAGKEKALNSIVGKVMQKTKGQAKPDLVTSIIKQLI
jgi:aspartyl-tRNA(Asn)/glutamyl-tRNA(Gln) amidotransferase subunit B